MNPTASSTVSRKRRRASNRERRVNVLHRHQQKNPSDKTNIENDANRRPKPLQSGRLIHSCVVRYAIKRLIKIQRAQLVNIRRAPTFSGYKALFTEGVTELGCVAHARRKFFDLNAAQENPIALEALNRIAALYVFEAHGRDMTVEARTRWRQERAQPLLDSMQDWLRQTRVMVANGSGLARAMALGQPLDYSLKRWDALSRYATDGRFPIDNNPVENIIRPIAVGRRNWLFTGSERAGKRAAAIQTLLGTAKLNGLDPAAWLRDTLKKLPTCLNSEIDSLLPLRTDSIHPQCRR